MTFLLLNSSERAFEIYRHLGEWCKNELNIEHRYREIGARRAPRKFL